MASRLSDYPILPDTAPTAYASLWPRFWTRTVVPDDARYFEPSQHAELVLARYTEPDSYTRTLVCDGEPLCAWGIAPLWEGVGKIWIFRRDAERMAAHALVAARHIKQTVDAWRVDGPYRWIECYVRAGDTQIESLLQWLGFKCVCVKHHYGSDGKTLFEYAWWRDS